MKPLRLFDAFPRPWSVENFGHDVRVVAANGGVVLKSFFEDEVVNLTSSDCLDLVKIINETKVNP